MAWKLLAGPGNGNGPGSRYPTTSDRFDALEELDLRYASGELDRQDYEERRQTIEGHRRP